MRRSYVINHENQEITFDLNFFKALLLKKPKEIDKDLSISTLRLAFLLMNELDEIMFKKIKPRKELAEQLGVSRNSITNSLMQLEECGFIIRKLDDFPYMICAYESSQNDLDKALEVKLESSKKNRKFSGEFKINSNYNNSIYSDIKEFDNPEFLKNLIIEPKKLQKDTDRINNLEKRISFLEKLLKINI